VVHCAPLMRAGQRLGWLWLLGQHRLPVDCVATLASAVAEACPLTPPDQAASAVRAALDGDRPLPAHLVGRARYAWVVTMTGDRPSNLSLALSSQALPDLLVAEYEDHVKAVLLQEQLDDGKHVADRLAVVVEEASRRVGTQLQAGLSEPVPADEPLSTAASQAEAACRVSRPGSCVSVRQVRSRVVLELVRAAVRQLPDLGPDPVELLGVHDRRRGSELSATVRHWIDAGGDVTAAAACMSLHPNTLRYRLRCAEAVAGVALDDLSVQLELHLRLPDAPSAEARIKGAKS
jgi:sugar diacid utilization regulator